MKPTNCYTFASAPGETEMRLVQGFHLAEFRRKLCVPMWTPSGYGWRVPLQDDLHPALDALLHEADLVPVVDAPSNTPAYELVRRKDDVDVTLLLVMSDYNVTSSTGYTEKPHFVMTYTWVGAEDSEGLLVHSGIHQDTMKKQLCRLRSGESILYIDSNKEGTRLTADTVGMPPIRNRATNTEVADYVLREVQKRGPNRSARAWCFHALQELGCKRQITQFQKMFPDFKVKR